MTLTNGFTLKKNKIYLLLGSNLGNSNAMLQTALQHIEKGIGKVLRKSALYKTAAWGKSDQPDFLNQVLLVHSVLTAKETMQRILEIEQLLGRVRNEKYASRLIDIDLLYFNKDVIKEKDLIIPHPAIAQRNFVLYPLNEISPNFIHPVLKKNNHTMLLKSKDPLSVKKIIGPL